MIQYFLFCILSKLGVVNWSARVPGALVDCASCTVLKHTRTAHLGVYVMAEGESCMHFLP